MSAWKYRCYCDYNFFLIIYTYCYISSGDNVIIRIDENSEFKFPECKTPEPNNPDVPPCRIPKFS